MNCISAICFRGAPIHWSYSIHLNFLISWRLLLNSKRSPGGRIIKEFSIITLAGQSGLLSSLVITDMDKPIPRCGWDSHEWILFHTKHVPAHINRAYCRRTKPHLNPSSFSHTNPVEWSGLIGWLVLFWFDLFVYVGPSPDTGQIKRLRYRSKSWELAFLSCKNLFQCQLHCNSLISLAEHCHLLVFLTGYLSVWRGSHTRLVVNRWLSLSWGSKSISNFSPGFTETI